MQRRSRIEYKFGKTWFQAAMIIFCFALGPGNSFERFNWRLGSFWDFWNQGKQRFLAFMANFGEVALWTHFKFRQNFPAWLSENWCAQIWSFSDEFSCLQNVKNLFSYVSYHVTSRDFWWNWERYKNEGIYSPLNEARRINNWLFNKLPRNYSISSCMHHCCQKKYVNSESP